MVEKLVEETASSDQHLRQLISICDGKLLNNNLHSATIQLYLCPSVYKPIIFYAPAQRQVGETALNDTSSRSHQIIRLVSSLNAIYTFQVKYC